MIRKPLPTQAVHFPETFGALDSRARPGVGFGVDADHPARRSARRLSSPATMKLRLATLVLVPSLTACGSLFDDQSATSPVRPAVFSRDLVVRPQEASAQNEVDWFRSGPYLGATVGWALSNADESDIDSDLSDRGWTSDTDLDDGDIGWKAFGGYRFEEPFAIEVAAVDLGTIESDIDVNTADIRSFLNDVADVHPFSAKGAALTGTWYALDQADWQLGLKGGLWWWDGEVEVDAASGERAGESDSGLDLVLGGVGLFELGEEWALRAEVEHYWVEDDGVTLFSIGAQWSPDDRSRRPASRSGARDLGLPPALLRQPN